METSNQLMEPELELLIAERILLHYNRLKAKKINLLCLSQPLFVVVNKLYT